MRTKRKQTRRLPEPWPTFDGAHERAPSLNGLLSEHEWEVLREIYERLVLSRELGTDNLGHDEALCDELATSFAGIVERFWAIGEGLTVPDFLVRVTAKGSRTVDFLIDPVLGGRYIWVKLTREPNCRRMACVPARDRLAGFFMRWGWAKSPRPVRAV